MHFIYDNGTTVMVPQVGGMLAYYLYYLDNLKAFPEGFQMIAGNLAWRNFTGPFPDTALSSWATDATDDQYFLQQRALGFNCLNYQVDPEPSLYRHVMPSKEYMDAHCTDGLRLELAFPSCGTGEKDSEDHKSHMAYPSLVKEGNCPDGYDVHYPFLFYETIWATDTFAGEDGQFVLSYGDPVGAGYHGDFIMGWESEEFLQNALDTCTNLSGDIADCPLFDIQDSSKGGCTFDMPEELKNDNPLGPRNGLAVDVPIQYGPEDATTYAIAGANGQPTKGIDTTSAPHTLSSMPTLSYSPADPESTKTAQGGIVVAMQTSAGRDPATAVELPQSSATPRPTPASDVASADVASGNADGASIVSTKYITEGNKVIELFIEETDVYVTATATATETDAAQWKRHLHRHQHRHAHY